MPRALIGKTIEHGRYQIESQLGEGGMGVVYLGFDNRLDTKVVIKAPHRSMLHEVGFKERFQREIQSLVKLAHPHIVSIIDVGEYDELPYCVMQFLGGGSLEDRRASFAKMDAKNKVGALKTWLPAISSALDFIHSKGFIHRDVKPANILFDDHGNAFLSDFGIAKVIADSEEKKRHLSLTGTGMAMGTPEYMAPELCDGSVIDSKVDQYALAITVYEMLVGNCPFIGPTPLATIFMHKTNKLASISEQVKGIPRHLADAIGRGLSKESHQRFANCAQFSSGIFKYDNSTYLSSEPRTASGRSRRGLNTASKLRKIPGSQANPMATNVAVKSGDSAVADSKPIRVNCNGCGKRLKLLPEHIGRRIKCPGCGSKLMLSESELAPNDSSSANDQKPQKDLGTKSESERETVVAAISDTAPNYVSPTQGKIRSRGKPTLAIALIFGIGCVLVLAVLFLLPQPTNQGSLSSLGKSEPSTMKSVDNPFSSPRASSPPTNRGAAKQNIQSTTSGAFSASRLGNKIVMKKSGKIQWTKSFAKLARFGFQTSKTSDETYLLVLTDEYFIDVEVETGKTLKSLKYPNAKAKRGLEHILKLSDSLNSLFGG